ncbi:MAG: DUF3575 domain-containing protein [Bacteroidales bacterium]|nr:DUF3575 domain-containing protein [Bacteroidales bacterium]
MKKLLFVTLLIGGMISSTFAQQNVVKWYPLSLGSYSLKFQYERNLAPQHSVALDVKYIMPLKLGSSLYSPFFKDVDFPTAKATGYSLSPEYRYYTKEISAGSLNYGFYLAPYLKYTKIDLEFEGNTLEGHDVGVNLDYSAFGGGLGIGYQWVIDNKITVDWLIFGIGVSSYNIAFDYSNTDPSEKFGELKDEIANFEYLPGSIGEKLDMKTIEVIGKNAGLIDGMGKFSYMNFKSGLSIGYAF